MKKLLVLILAGLMVFSLAACGGGSGEAEQAEQTAEDEYVMQIMSSPALCSAPLFVAMENGYLDEVGVKYEYFNSDSNQWDLMAAGKCDVAYGLLPTFIQRLSNGFEMKVVTGAHYGCINVVATDASGIQSIPDLKGRNVGIPGGMGSDPAILLQRMLIAYGVAVEDVNLMVFDNADLATALQDGQVEAFVSWDPYATIVSQYEGNHLIFNQADDEATKNEYCCVLGLRNDFVEEHPEVAKKYIEAFSMACDYIAENPTDAAKMIYDAGYVADADYEFNGKLLDSYRYKANFADAKESFARVTDDLINLGIITIDTDGAGFAEKFFVNIGEID